MLITREADYALRILRALSQHEQMTTKEICDQELLPQQFVYKILKKLDRAGWVAVLRGINGGCRLNTELKNVTLFDLITIMEADKKVSSCMQADFNCPWREKHHVCQVHNHLWKIQQELDQKLQEYTLYDILFDK